jgi:hypothetical protein
VADLLGIEDELEPEALAKFLKSSGAFAKTGEPRAKPPLPSTEDDELYDGDAGGQAQEWREENDEGSPRGGDEGDIESDSRPDD